MFYSETLLQKTGPLAKVWLAANVERKLTKGDYLKQNISKDVHNIVNDEQAPLALRLTSQLLLGVVRIYSRKARYLLDDCNEALLKIKLAFRPGNVELPSAQSHIANPTQINMPETITDLDHFNQTDLDDLLMFCPMPGLGGAEMNWGTSQVLPDTTEDSIEASQALQLEEDDLDLDLGLDTTAPSIEVGRRAATPRRDELYMDDDLQLDLGLDDTTMAVDANMHGQDNEVDMFDTRKEGALTSVPARDRSESPLSDIGADQATELEQTFQLNLEEDVEEEPEDETQVQAQQRVKRRKLLQNDLTTELGRDEIKAQQDDRSKILRQPSFLPRDPMLLALLNMQRSGGFVSSILGDQQPRGWAPKIRGILSLEVVRKAGELKRKRDDEANPASSSRAPDDEEAAAVVDEEPLNLDDNDDFAPLPQYDEENTLGLPPASPGVGAFDETTHALVAPADSGPVSLATKHTVHMLRERFGSIEGPPSPNTRKMQSVLFTDLCPPARTTRHDATKLFFETLVLATKDAVKVEQVVGEGLGAPFRIRAKRGLWGDWAETGVGGFGGVASQAVDGGEEVGEEEA